MNLPKEKLTRILTADDWGFSPAVNEGILELVQMGAINNVALTANMPFLEHKLSELLEQRNCCHFSLHFNIVDGNSLNPHARTLLSAKTGMFPGLKQQIFRSFSFQLESHEVADEFESQLNRLQELGVPVNRINGHQHAHLLPGVMSSIFPVMQRNGLEIARLPLDSDLWLSTKNFLSVLSHLNEVLYPTYRPCFERCYYHLKKLSAHRNCEFLFHPAWKLDFDEFGVSDPYREPRIHEYNILKSCAEEIKDLVTK